MSEFIIGFLTCWVVLGIYELLSEKYEWYYDDWHWWITSLPVLAVVVPIGVLGMIVIWTIKVVDIVFMNGLKARKEKKKNERL